MQRVNPEGLYAVVQAALPHFSARGGRFVVVSPPIYSRFFRGKTAYGMGKVAMSVLTKGLAMDLERQGRAGDTAIISVWPAVVRESARRGGAERLTPRLGHRVGRHAAVHRGRPGREERAPQAHRLLRRHPRHPRRACRPRQRPAAARRGLPPRPRRRLRLCKVQPRPGSGTPPHHAPAPARPDRGGAGRRGTAHRQLRAGQAMTRLSWKRGVG